MSGNKAKADKTEYLTFGEAAKLAPGRPSANAVWRWARRGVKSRAGQKIYLRHIRAGGRVLTRADWIEQFCRELAEADAAHFNDEASYGKEVQQPNTKPTGMAAHERAMDRLRRKGLS